MAQIGTFGCKQSAPKAIAAPPETQAHSPRSAKPRYCCRCSHVTRGSALCAAMLMHIASHPQAHVMHDDPRQSSAGVGSLGMSTLNARTKEKIDTDFGL
jgi:hypothetical protein